MKRYLYLLIIILLVSGCNKESTYLSRNMNYMDTIINIKLYDNSKKALEALSKIDEIYSEYDKLADRYKAYDNIININYINNKLSINQDLIIDKKLYDILEYSKSFASKTNNLFNIALGNVIDVWASYRKGEKEGIPSIDELKSSGSINLDDLVLKDNNTIMKKSMIVIDLGAIAKGYVTEVVGDYLDSIGLHNYLITAGTSSIKAGNHYKNSDYKIGLINPSNPNDIYKIIKGHNMSVTTSGSFERYYEYEGIRYGHIIDPNTLFPSDHMLSVMVITDDAALGEILSTTLFLMPIDEGIEYLKQFEGVEAIWYESDNNIVMSDGMKAYE